MEDLELAKRILEDERFALVVVKEKRILFKTRSPGISGLLQAIEELGERLHKSSIADRVVGRAAALLCAYSEIETVFAAILSTEGLKTLQENGIKFEFERLVPRILDRDKRDTCQFEIFSLTIKSPKEAYRKLREFSEVYPKSVNSAS